MLQGAAARATAPRKNVLFITCDQWRGGCLSAAGHPVVETPNADALARGGAGPTLSEITELLAAIDLRVAITDVELG